MKKTIFVLSWLCAALCVAAQTTPSSLEETKARLVEFNTERLLDSLDQEKLPRMVSGGVFAGANVSNFIITRNHQPMSSYMRIGGELGGFLDFRLNQHFSIQPQVLITAQQNYFEATNTTNHLWSFGAEVPIYFLGRYGNMEKGYIQFGGGIFTHFTFASNIANKFKNMDDQSSSSPSPAPQQRQAEEPKYDYSRLYSLHNNHFGICLTVGYEFPIGIQINFNYLVSVTDMFGFYKNNKGTLVGDCAFYPERLTLGIAYRWK